MKDNEDRKYQFLRHSQSVVPLVQQPTTAEFHLDPCWMPFCDEHSQKLYLQMVNWLNLTYKKANTKQLLRQHISIIRQKNPP